MDRTWPANSLAVGEMPLLSAAIALCLQGCLNISTTGYAGYTSTPSTGSTTAVITTAGSSNGSTGTSSGAISSSTGGATSSGTSTGGSPHDAGICPGTDPELQSSQTYTLAGAVAMSNSADFNGDGFLDVVVTEVQGGPPGGCAGGGPCVAVFLGLKDGGLLLASEAVDHGVDPGGPLVAADVNGDGWPDVIGFGGDGFVSGIVVLLNVDGGLTPAQVLIPGFEPSFLAVGDLNQDLIPDILEVDLAGTTVTAFLGTGDGKFSAPIFVASLAGSCGSIYPCAENVPTLFLSDLNEDGFPDVVAAPSGSSQLVVALHEPDGGYRSAYYDFPGPVVAAPLQVPGQNPGLIVGYNVDAGESTGSWPLGPAPFLHGVVQLLDNPGNGQMTKGTTFDTPNRANALLVADFNLDGLEDVAIGSNGCWQEGSLSVLFGEPDSGLGDCVFLGPPPSAAGALTILGSVRRGHALGTNILCGEDLAIEDPALTVFGDASQ